MVGGGLGDVNSFWGAIAGKGGGMPATRKRVQGRHRRDLWLIEGMTMHLRRLLEDERYEEIARFYASLAPCGQWQDCAALSNMPFVWDTSEILAKYTIGLDKSCIELSKRSVTPGPHPVQQPGLI